MCMSAEKLGDSTCSHRAQTLCDNKSLSIIVYGYRAIASAAIATVAATAAGFVSMLVRVIIYVCAGASCFYGQHFVSMVYEQVC